MIRDPLPSHGGVDGHHALQHEHAGPQQLARDLAMLGARAPAAAVERRGDAAATPPPAVVPRAEDGLVVARGVVGGEVGGEQEELGGRGEEVGQVGRGLGEGRFRGFGLRGGGGGAAGLGPEAGLRLLWLLVGGGGGDDGGREDGLVLQVGACRDQELRELAGFVGAGGDGRGEARPQRQAGLLQAWQGPRGGLGERVVDCGDEAGV